MNPTTITIITTTFLIAYTSAFAHGIHTQTSAGHNNYLIRWPAITALVIGLLIHTVGTL